MPGPAAKPWYLRWGPGGHFLCGAGLLVLASSLMRLTPSSEFILSEADAAGKKAA